MNYRVLLVAAVAAMVGFSAQAAEIKYTASGIITEPLVLTEDTTIIVASGVTVTNAAKISGNFRITKTGEGILALDCAENDFGSLYIDTGIVDVKTGGALGTAPVTVKGGTTALSQLRFANMDYGQTQKTITFSNAITIEYGGDASHYQLRFGPHGLSGKRQSIKFTGPVVCNGDLYFSTDGSPEFSAIASNLSFTFADVLSARKFHIDRTTVAGTFSGRVDVDEFETASGGTATYTFSSDANRIGKISPATVRIAASASGALGGAAIDFQSTSATSATFVNMNTYSQTSAWLRNSRQAAKEYIISKKSNVTLTITGGVESACFHGFLTNDLSSVNFKMNLTLDAGNEDFVQAFSNNVHSISGDITVKKGTLLFGGATSLVNVPAINVEGGAFKLDTTLDDPLPSLEMLSIGEMGFVDMGGRIIVADTLTIDGVDCASADHDSHPSQIAAGTVLRARLAPTGMSYTTTDMTALGDWEIKVPANSTNVVQVRQTGSGRIIKSGAGTLTFRDGSKDSTFTGGVVIEEGRVGVEVDNALGTGEVTILGQRAEYTGVCQLDMVGRDVGAGDFTTPTVTISNDVHVTGNTSMAYPAVMGYYQNAKLAGKVTAEQDFCFLDDQSTTYSCADKSYSGAQGRVLSLEFGEVEVKGLMMHDGWARFYFDGKVTASALKCTVCRGGGGASNWKASYYFRDDVEFGSITNQARNMWFYKKLTIDGAHVLPSEGKYSSYVQGNLYLRGTASTIGGFSDCVPTLSTNDVTKKWFVQPDSGSVTLTLTGVEGEPELTTHYMFNGNLSLTLDAPGFTQIFANRTNTMSGVIWVKNGTMKVSGEARFANVASLIVEPGASFVNESTAQGSLAALKNLTLATGAVCELGLPAGTTLNLTTLTIDGVRMPIGDGYTHEVHPAIPEGITLNVSSGMIAAKNVAVWTGAATDGKMSTLGNWLMDGAVPESLASLDLMSGTTTVSIEGGTEMIPDIDGVCIHSITNNRAAGSGVPTFYIGATGRTLSVVGQIISFSKANLGLRGIIAGYKGTVQAVDATENGACVLTCDNAGTGAGSMLYLAGVTLKKPAYLNTTPTGGNPFIGEANTTNLLMCAVRTGGNANNKPSVQTGGVVEFAGGVKQNNRPMKVGDGTMVISGKPASWSTGISIEGGCFVLACPGNVFKCYNNQNRGVRLGTASNSSLKFDCSYCLEDNDQEQLEFLGDKKTTVDFGCTTQLFSRVYGSNTHSDSCMTGDYPAMLEVKGGTKWTTEWYFLGLTNSVQITGGLGFHYLGNGPATDGIAPAGSNDVYVLTGKAFATTGNLEVSGGTLELAADATWRNGTCFAANGEGLLRFTAAGQVGSQAVFRFAGNGKVEIPAGVTYRCTAIDVEGYEPIETGVFDKDSTGAMAGRIIGDGSLKVGRRGMLLMVQ